MARSDSVAGAAVPRAAIHAHWFFEPLYSWLAVCLTKAQKDGNICGLKIVDTAGPT